MRVLNVLFNDGRKMTVEPGVTFTGTNHISNGALDYICFTDNRYTGPFLAKRQYTYYIKVDPNTNQIIYSDNDDDEEFDFVKETIAGVLNCKKKGLLCLFELVRGGVKSVTITDI